MHSVQLKVCCTAVIGRSGMSLSSMLLGITSVKTHPHDNNNNNNNKNNNNKNKNRSTRDLFPVPAAVSLDTELQLGAHS